MGIKLQDGERPFKLTQEEEARLDGVSKAYIRGYQVKKLHVCPNCGKACGWNSLATCLGCGYKLKSLEEFNNLERRERWMKI